MCGPQFAFKNEFEYKRRDVRRGPEQQHRANKQAYVMILDKTKMFDRDYSVSKRHWEYSVSFVFIEIVKPACVRGLDRKLSL